MIWQDSKLLAYSFGLFSKIANAAYALCLHSNEWMGGMLVLHVYGCFFFRSFKHVKRWQGKHNSYIKAATEKFTHKSNKTQQNKRIGSLRPLRLNFPFFTSLPLISPAHKYFVGNKKCNNANKTSKSTHCFKNVEPDEGTLDLLSSRESNIELKFLKSLRLVPVYSGVGDFQSFGSIIAPSFQPFLIVDLHLPRSCHNVPALFATLLCPLLPLT